MSKKEEYKRTCEDEIDWVNLEQLHEATLQISNQCSEYKKLCVSVIGVIVAALLKLGEPASLSLISGVCVVISTGFWFGDSIAYYYQKSNREKMGKITDDIKRRNSIDVITVVKLQEHSWGRSFWNPSMSLYHYITVVCVIAVIYDNFSKL
ncbi:hypothetical protein RUK45_003400 [Vibrio cholerae]|nr:hypothetical protein [Vibrio cholerae]EKF9197550.1 hypothetical protein [Vibrio cholerae]EKF9238335.1 hypothetical protein [Vibrio cholerae]ELJ8531322.1 hypothetical protein [Vibrio cholerae]